MKQRDTLLGRAGPNNIVAVGSGHSQRKPGAGARALHQLESRSSPYVGCNNRSVHCKRRFLVMIGPYLLNCKILVAPDVFHDPPVTSIAFAQAPEFEVPRRR